MNHVGRSPFLLGTAQDFRVGFGAAAIPGAPGLFQARAAEKAELHFNVIERERHEADSVGSVHACNCHDGPNGCAWLE